MPRPRKHRRCKAAEVFWAQSETQKIVGVPEAIPSSTCSSSFPSPSSSLSSFSPEPSGTSKEVFVAAGPSSPSQSSQIAGSFTAVVSSSCSQSIQGSQKQSKREPISTRSRKSVVPWPYSETHVKVYELVRFLLHNYQMCELNTKSGMLNTVIRNYQEKSPMIFSEARKWMLLVFGLEVKEVDSCAYPFVLVPALDLTYDGILSSIQGIPKTGLLIMVLCIIFKEGSRATERVVWRVLNRIGLYVRRYNFLYGYSKKLVTMNFVWEGYLKYQQVPHTDPVCYDFLWGPRAHAEVSKIKVLHFLSKVNRFGPTQCSMQML